jgi:prepilin peptidase CpaA
VQSNNELVYCAIGSVVASVAACYDVKLRRIPNYLTGAGLLSGLLMHFSLDGWKGLLGSLLAALAAGCIFLVFFMAGGMGGGDVKLMIAVAAITGLQETGSLLICTSLAGGAMGIVLALMRGAFRQTLSNVTAIAGHHLHHGLTPHPELHVQNKAMLRLPYGVAIAAGSVATLYLQRIHG